MLSVVPTSLWPSITLSALTLTGGPTGARGWRGVAQVVSGRPRDPGPAGVAGGAGSEGGWRCECPIRAEWLYSVASRLDG